MQKDKLVQNCVQKIVDKKKTSLDKDHLRMFNIL
jgi:hypothetical protein